jgi:hypothetical protein
MPPATMQQRLLHWSALPADEIKFDIMENSIWFE